MTQAIRSPKNPGQFTPHPGELARLVGSTIEDVQADRVAAARGAAVETGVVVVLKGARTAIEEARPAMKNRYSSRY